MTAHHSPLTKATDYPDTYTPSVLFPIARAENRTAFGIRDPWPFHGHDLWNAYELSWLDPQGKPQVALGQYVIPCTSVNLIESKSFKLYLNSFNQTVFTHLLHVQQTMENDLSKAAGAKVEVQLFSVEDPALQPRPLQGFLLDNLEITTDTYEPCPDFLSQKNLSVQEILVSHLLRSNCPVTHQPDWGTVIIRYEGKQIDHEGLLKYIISFRKHSGFHEECVERMFQDLMTRVKPETLTIEARYTRRGGLDINPIRSTEPLTAPLFSRLIRQ
ncbi:MAG TPA: NADPH-dependent 7-cyano-7-deazaguanine reductase QueF [Coxiellaceae bacterium]|nr:NADPH-dependent 7-cyano-7-deazaguanine reductase QueF [Coxiellaceae bacterium]